MHRKGSNFPFCFAADKVSPPHLLLFSLVKQVLQIVLRLGICGVAAALQTIYSFSFLAMVTPVSYAVASVTKRLSIIAASAVIFQTHLTALNIAGIAISTVRFGGGASLQSPSLY